MVWMFCELCLVVRMLFGILTLVVAMVLMFVSLSVFWL